MRLHKPTLLALAFALAFFSAGCGPSKAEREAKERERLELEARAQAEARKANEAVTNMNKKLGRKPPAVDLGVPAEKKPEPTPEKPTAP